ncbi:hypothetical protein L0Y65_06305 [Candidatus Micrarchaeota archaeon]|nr:hypothetical protein [Candidatus Micrarchaeota archaeon]
MTQPTAFQADVNVRTLRAPQARDAMEHPVELRRGEVRGITLTIPLLTDRTSYLVVRLPDEVVRGLLEHVRTLPPPERADFIRQWVMRNQQAVIEQHVRSGGRERRFRYDIVPVQAMPRVTEATPRRVEPPAQQPVATAVPRREAVAPQPASPGQPARRIIQPGQPARSPQVRVEPQPGPVFAPDRPAERPVPAPPAARRREEESWWLGGRGTQREPYRIRMLTGRARGNGIEASEIEIPISISSVGRFAIGVTLSQISASRFEATYREMLQLCRQGYAQTEEGRGGRVQLLGVPGMRDMRERLYGQLPPDLRRYAQSH